MAVDVSMPRQHWCNGGTARCQGFAIANFSITTNQTVSSHTYFATNQAHQVSHINLSRVAIQMISDL